MAATRHSKLRAIDHATRETFIGIGITFFFAFIVACGIAAGWWLRA
jgi:hypothetical protein